jgi:hypothetical protein
LVTPIDLPQRQNEALFSLQRRDLIRGGATTEKGHGFALSEGS